MTEYYHGTSARAAQLIQAARVMPSLFVSTDFDLAASYALGKPEPRILVLAGSVENPSERAYDGEYLSGDMQVLRVLRCRYEDIPDDYYELDESLSGRKYPHLFDPENWYAE